MAERNINEKRYRVNFITYRINHLGSSNYFYVSWTI